MSVPIRHPIKWEFGMVWLGWTAEPDVSCQKYELVWLAASDWIHWIIITFHGRLCSVDGMIASSLLLKSFLKISALFLSCSKCPFLLSHLPQRKSTMSPVFWKVWGRRIIPLDKQSLWGWADCE